MDNEKEELQDKITETPTWLPCFPGFYGTALESDSAEEMGLGYINEQREAAGLPELESGDVEFDFDDYMNRVALEVLETVRLALCAGVAPWAIDIRFEKMIHPKEYNFANDSVDVLVKLSEANIRKLWETLNGEDSEFSRVFEEDIRRRYTSCDGFMSHYPNSVEEWMGDGWDSPEFRDTVTDRHKLGRLLEFVCEDVLELNIEEDLEQTSYIALSDTHALPEEIPDIHCGRCGRLLNVRWSPQTAETDKGLYAEPCPCTYARLLLAVEDGMKLGEAFHTMDNVAVGGEHPSHILAELFGYTR